MNLDPANTPIPFGHNPLNGHCGHCMNKIKFI